MFSVRRWWEQHGLSIFLTGLVLVTAWFLRQTQGAAISELYYWLTRPFDPKPSASPRATTGIQPPSAAEYPLNSSTVIVDPLTQARLLELEQHLAELEKQNQRLQELVGYLDQQKQPGIAAPVIGRSANSWWKQITIGRGQQDGIKVGDVVSGVGGIVGRVIQVTPHTSRILLVSDPTSRVGVTISRSRQMGYIQGLGSQMAILQFFEKVPNVRPGDGVATSTYSRLYSPGLPVGRVKSVNLKKGPAPEAIVELTAPLNVLEWVVVHPFDGES